MSDATASKPHPTLKAEPRSDGIVAAVRQRLDHMERENGKLAAFVSILRESALAEAELAERQALAGAAHGPLHGMPVGVKDIIDVAGLPSGCGSLTRKQAAPADKDAPVVGRLRNAGAVVVGKTHTVEFAFGGYGTNVTVGTPHNPWDRKTHRIPGGSSSGSGVAVGARLLPGALGTDTGGSVRIPAALCGCVGLKTSVGLVGRSGVAPLSGTFDSIGPLAQDVTTAAHMLAAMQGHDPADRSTDGVRPVAPLDGLERGISGLRIGRIEDRDLPLASAEVKADFNAALQQLADLGARIEPVRLPESFDAYGKRCGFFIAAEAYATYRALVDDANSGLAPAIRTRMLAGRTISAADYIAAVRQQRHDIAAMLSVFDRLDAIALPTLPFPAIPVQEVDEAKSPMAEHTRWVNYCELAGLAVPTSVAKSGLPLSLQIVVRRFDDALALRIGRAFEQARGAFPAPPV